MLSSMIIGTPFLTGSVSSTSISLLLRTRASTASSKVASEMANPGKTILRILAARSIRSPLAALPYQSDQDTLGDFIEERMERGLGFKVAKRAAYASYVQWAKESGHWYPVGSKAFSKRLKERGFRDLASREWADCRLKDCLPFDD